MNSPPSSVDKLGLIQSHHYIKINFLRVEVGTRAFYAIRRGRGGAKGHVYFILFYFTFKSSTPQAPRRVSLDISLPLYTTLTGVGVDIKVLVVNGASWRNSQLLSQAASWGTVHVTWPVMLRVNQGSNDSGFWLLARVGFCEMPSGFSYQRQGDKRMIPE